MTEDKIHQNRPGRKALFAGAQIPRETSKTMPRDFSSEFISKSTKVLDDFLSGNTKARIDPNIADEDAKFFASTINNILEITESRGELEEKDRLINVLENELSNLKKSTDEPDNILLNEELNSLKSEITALNNIKEDLKQRLKETENEYKQYIETQDEKIIELKNIAIADTKKELLTVYESEKENILSALLEKEEKLREIEAEIALERENIKNRNSLISKIDNELKETKNLFNIKDEEISKLQAENIKLKETFSNKSEETKNLFNIKDGEISKLQTENIKLKETFSNKSEETKNLFNIKDGEISKLQTENIKLKETLINKSEEINSVFKQIDVLKLQSETIIQQNPMPIILLNKNLTILVTNKKFEEMSGINKSKLLDMNLDNFKINYIKGDNLNVIFSSKQRSYCEISIDLPTGTHILEQYAIPILNEKSEISNILIVFNEITALRIREREIENLMEKAKDESVYLEESAKAITSNMVALAKGDLVTKAKILENDHLKVLKEKFNESILSFRILIEEINKETNLIEGTSEELRRNNENIAHATEKLAQNASESSDFTRNLTEHFEKISNSISDLSASIEEISSTSQEVMKKTQLATSEGKTAANIGKDASLKMEAIGEISKKSVEEINSLNDEMYKINDIVNLISRIAEQTNMLALNAAIEAARAGEHGRGFSVVAGEVKNLAGESKKAALEIQNMISRIQKNSENTADSMRHVDEEMRIGIKSTNSAISALNKIVDDIETASNGMTEISKATEIQAYETNSFIQSIEIANEMTREIIKRIESIAALSEEISATTQEVGGISHEMHEMSAGLKNTMKKFNL